MNNLKKFFAFSIATAMVAGAVWAGTPAVKSLAAEYELNKLYWWNGRDGADCKYVEIAGTKPAEYVEVRYLGENKFEETGSHSGDDSSGSVIKPGDSESTFAVNSVEIEGPDHVYLYLGEPRQFFAKVRYSGYSGDKQNPDAVKWECKPKGIANVNENGLVTPIKCGEAEIIATSIWDSTQVDSFTITVVPEPVELRFKDVDPEKGLTVKVGGTIEIELDAEDAKKYPLAEYKYDWGVDFGPDESKEEIAAVTEDGKIIGKITGKAEGQCVVFLAIEPLSDNSEPYTNPVAFAECRLEVVSADTKETTTEDESSKKNATPVDPTAATPEAQAKQEQTPESIANYQTWLATYGGGTTAAAGTTTVSGTVGQPGSEAIVNTASGAPVAMFQSNDTTNTLLAAPVGVVPSGTKIETVEAGKDSAAFKAAQNRLSSVSRRGTVQKVYGITGLNADGSQITTLNGKAAMSMPVPTDVTVPTGKALKVYLIPDNGQPTKLDTLIDQGRVVFEIPKFGTFAFVVE